MRRYSFVWLTIGLFFAVLTAAPAGAVTGLSSNVEDCKLRVRFVDATATPASVSLVVTHGSSTFEDRFEAADLSKVERSYSMQGFDGVTMTASVSPDGGALETASDAQNIGCGAQPRATVAGVVFERSDLAAAPDLARTGSTPARLAVAGMLGIALGALAYLARLIMT